ncbi:hypothetical protein [Methylobacterium sp. Leaf108]|uniref:hypothetical protein n=1 Tax=Methylobacterium sp. Leaf108 TaxID=1736256 RepID=UPI0006F49D53|nr:hypothetical protein [Methylobacterium sp. Leaf108]KQP55204.1 hypothetical protein ASF39_05705 [Methylobacterium sp. Leaf108]
MTSTIIRHTVLGFAMALAVLGAAPEAQAKGCIKGAIVGGVAGHMAGHGVMGAVAGCAVGRHQANKQDKQTTTR